MENVTERMGERTRTRARTWVKPSRRAKTAGEKDGIEKGRVLGCVDENTRRIQRTKERIYVNCAIRFILLLPRDCALIKSRPHLAYLLRNSFLCSDSLRFLLSETFYAFGLIPNAEITSRLICFASRPSLDLKISARNKESRG